MPKQVLILACLALVLGGCDTAPTRRSAETPQFFAMAGADQQHLPFSEAVRSGPLLFLSGQIGVRPGTLELVPGGIEPQTRQAMENIKAVLARQHASFDDVVKCTAFLADMREWPAFNSVYRTFFSTHFPARSAFGATGLALGARVEIECVAAAP
ncbi:MAG: Rid family detoxifying hydrolase, partial [Rhodanobacteraceae bacterium]